MRRAVIEALDQRGDRGGCDVGLVDTFVTVRLQSLPRRHRSAARYDGSSERNTWPAMND